MLICKVEVEPFLLLAADALAAMFYVYKNTTQNAPWIRDGNKILYFEN